MQISGKTAMVTGAAKRVGREIALTLAQAGANIVLHYNRSKDEAERTKKDIQALGVRCRLAQADLTRADEVSKMVATLYAEGPVDILINSASLYYATPIQTVSENDWDALVDSNLKAPFLLSKEVGLRMAAASGGKIVNIADWSGFRPYKDFAPYCSAKGGLITLTKSLARDLAPKVQANAVAPGPVLAPPDMSEAEREAIAKTTALGRWGSPQDIARAVLFLAESDFINGTVLVVDGGRSIV